MASTAHTAGRYYLPEPSKWPIKAASAMLFLGFGAALTVNHLTLRYLLLAIVVAVAGVILTNALIRGMQHDMREAAVANLTGHIKVLAPGYLDDPNIEKSFKLAADWQPDVPARAATSR